MVAKKGRTLRLSVVGLFVALAAVYLLCLYGWAVFHRLFGDRWWWLFLINSFAIYLFLPLPVVVVFAVLARRYGLGIASGVAIILWFYLYGALFTPKFLPAQPTGRTLTVMTCNLLGFNTETAATIAALRAANVDVIAMQELNLPAAAAIQAQLLDLYPYQILAPQRGVTGLGVISRYRLQETAWRLPGAWLGGPQVLTLDFAGAEVLLVNFHSISVEFAGSEAYSQIEWSVQERERQARLLADFAKTQAKPVIALGDFNTSDQSTAYTWVTTTLRDAWREAGYGLGHTFPGAASSGSARPVIAGIPVPMWLIRIDYIFHSAQWQAVAAWLGPWNGQSDHRPVVAKLALRKG